MSLGTQIRIHGQVDAFSIPWHTLFYAFPPFRLVASSVAENQQGGGSRHIDRVEMDNPSMVPSTVEHASQPSKGNLLPQTATHTSPGTGLLPPAPQEAGPFSSAFIRDMLQSFGISAQAT